MLTPEREPIHLLIRFSDAIGAIEDTIQAHSNVIKKKGAVWFGKMGRTLGSVRLDRLNEQCAEGIPTYLYLVQRNHKTYQVFCGRIATVAREFPKNEKALVPTYYDANALTKYMTLWIKLTNLKEASTELNLLRVATSGGTMRETLHSSMAAMFAVKKRSSGEPIRTY